MKYIRLPLALFEYAQPYGHNFPYRWLGMCRTSRGCVGSSCTAWAPSPLGLSILVVVAMSRLQTAGLVEDGRFSCK